MKQKLERYGIQFIKEIIPVVSGILIALFIDNWNSERKDKIYVSQIFSTISNELKQSKEDIVDIIPKQEALIDSLDLHAENNNVSIQDVVMRSEGIFMPQIKLNAWKSIANTKIDLIDYKKIQSLSYIEEQKGILSIKTDYLMNFLYNNIHETDKKKKTTLKMILLDVVQTEKTTKRTIELFEQINK